MVEHSPQIIANEEKAPLCMSTFTTERSNENQFFVQRFENETPFVDNREGTPLPPPHTRPPPPLATA